jgi:hypothetical protein
MALDLAMYELDPRRDDSGGSAGPSPRRPVALGARYGTGR